MSTSQYRDISTIDSASYSYIFEQNVSVPLQSGGVLRCNVYRPKDVDSSRKYPVIATLGPYGKDVPYSVFNPKSFAELPEEHQTEHSAWETPTPGYWTAQGYVVVRADEPGIGQSPGVLDFLSKTTVNAFCDLIEWAADQPWSSGKVGLLGISYYAGMQWPVAARKPRGLAAIVPWEGFSDMYSEACRHGGILSNTFFQIWYARQIAPNQYGLPGRASRNWGPDTIDGDLSPEELAANRATNPAAYHAFKYRDNEFFTKTNFRLEDIQVPLLSVANWGGILLHLRGNVRAFTLASSEFKYLRFIVGRHDLPFYSPEAVEIQKSFLDAFLKGKDSLGWAERGKIPAINMVIRKGNVGFNDPIAEATFLQRDEDEWPLSRTEYTDFFLTEDNNLQFRKPDATRSTDLSYEAFGDGKTAISFDTEPFSQELEITGHIVAHLNVSISQGTSETAPSGMDLFVSLRHFAPDGKEILYTGSGGEGVPATKGSLRLALRQTNPRHPHHRPWQPHRDYTSADVLPVVCGEIYSVDVELWPTNLVVTAGSKLSFEISSKDTDGSGLFMHTDPDDRLVTHFYIRIFAQMSILADHLVTFVV
ncbi:hypothetical protein PFICI_11087 [Pestalotiopsis fici W106-1]|uniref:Xaa-Pro dipeptidyl-peptidase C-terminal domain-containing protein n=1 Tax=Pestalotiopsis fici (strain W106-1 / CGMCC3.15140) TaxID=1229662 RepID=W3WTN1_PESFW|nr:uncharacterized protein PFICI_11087 [Pestalotiopsis fici W106-1]ETS77213.1 hypothetical protein PFICI_11087 [Pestalotiopsis fici W106-1]